ncbi:MAG: porin [Minwuia sp.]|nr:porin [Minwuia sp.]
MNHKHLLAGVAATALLTSGSAFAASHSGDQLQAQAAMIDALSKKVEQLSANQSGGVVNGVKGATVKISGHVNRAVLVGSDDADNTFFQFVDNDASSTRFTFDVETPINASTVAGMRLEAQVESNSSIAVNAPGPQNADGATNSLRHAYVFVRGGFGALVIGQQSDASDGITQQGFNYATLADINPEHTAGQNLAGAGIGSFGDGSRRDSVRYDTPSVGGFKASISAEDTGQIHVGGIYGGKLGGIGVRAGLAYLGEEANAVKVNQAALVSGSLGFDFGPIALNTAFSTSVDDEVDGSDRFFWSAQLAHRGNYVDLGSTSIAIDYQSVRGVQDGGAAARFATDGYTVGVGLVQGLAPGVDAYAMARYYDQQGGGEATVGMAGMRVRF